MLQITFPEIARLLEGLRSSVPAAESHGCLCGALCARQHYPIERWLDEIVPQPDQVGEEGRKTLRLLFSDTLQALRGDQMEFDLLLPDDDTALKDRATALSQWCQGFLYGFGTGQPPSADDLPADVNEVLRDLTQIGRATVELDEGDEEEERAYAEIVEYVRAGVQLIHDEFAPLREDEGSGPDGTGPDDDEDFPASGIDPSKLN